MAFEWLERALKKITPADKPAEEEIDPEIDKETLEKLREGHDAPDDEVLKRNERYRREEALVKARKKIEQAGKE